MNRRAVTVCEPTTVEAVVAMTELATILRTINVSLSTTVGARWRMRASGQLELGFRGSHDGVKQPMGGIEKEKRNVLQ